MAMARQKPLPPLYIFREYLFLAPRYIRLEKRGIFRVAVEQKFGKGLFSGFNGCNAWMFGKGLFSGFKGWMLSFSGRGSRQEAA